MYCPQCGNANDDSAAFCSTCGLDLQKYKEQWFTPPGDDSAAAAASGPDAASATGSEGAPAGEPQAQPQQAPPSAYPPPSGYPPPYQQQYQPTYHTPPYQAGPGYQPAGYYQPGPYQPGYGIMPKISSYMGWAIATLILCFWPTGIVAVVYASKVGNLLALGDIRGAHEASGKAKTWCWVTFGIGVAWWIIWILIFMFVVAVGVSTGDSTF